MLGSNASNQQLEDLGARAFALGLQVTHDGVMRGEYDGSDIEIKANDAGNGCVVAATVDAPIGLATFTYSNGRFEERGEFAELDEVRSAVRHCEGLGCTEVALVGGRCIGQFSAIRAINLRAGEIQAVCRLAVAIAQQWRSVWVDWADRNGLAVDDGGRHIQGVVDGIPISIREADGGASIFSANLQTPLAAGTVVTASLRTQGAKVGDLILDHKLSIETSDLPTVASRLKTDAVRGPLLDFLLRQEGVVYSDRVQLIVVGRPTASELDDWVAQLTELAAALG